MEGKEGFLSAHNQRVLTLQTTHTPKFLDLQQGSGFWNVSNYGKGMIIGMLDTGVEPYHPSFSDAELPSPPSKWKGKCDLGTRKCNNKIICARNFVNSSRPPIDDNGHGTHTASTAAGSPVPGANFYGQLNGTAIGIAPLAHLAIYKVCNGFGSCDESDILAAMDAAVEDGADVISLSLGGPSLPFFNDSIALGAFRAIRKGILVSCAAGNSGPAGQSLSNEAPWILTVGAITVDRSIRATVRLGSKAEYDGESFFQPKDFPPKLLPLVYAGVRNVSSAYCFPGSLGDLDVKGKVVLCQKDIIGFNGAVDAGQTVKDAGGAAMIYMNDVFHGNITEASMNVLPASHVTYDAGSSILDYINSVSSPTATIVFKGTVFGVPYAPQVAYFSSRGPSIASPGILKPDILGPGYNILAAWPYSADGKTNTNKTFTMISGTSMACPHLSGTAALLKATNPTWSPATIKSAMLSTASVLNLGGQPITDQDFNPADIFTMGSGLVDASKADDPGLIYDIQPEDYIPYLCGLGYTDKQVVELIVQHPVTCSNATSIAEAALNYPSITLKLGSSSKTYTRIVTNVGPAKSAYARKVNAPNGVDVQVTPSQLFFTVVNQKVTYSVTFSRTTKSSNTFDVGSLIVVMSA